MSKQDMSQRFRPKVSIVIPVYNGSNYVKEAIDSALSQTYTNIEIIVINDGSTDGGATDKICRSYGTKIRYFVKENGGVASALNMGIEKMEGEYFSWLSHDDVYYPNKVESEINVLSKLEDKDTIIYSGLELVNANGVLIEQQNFAEKYGSENVNKPLYPFLRLALNGCTMLIHKNHFNRVGIFKTELPTTQDYDLWFRMIRNSKLYYDKNILLKSRSHQEQGSFAAQKDHIAECNTFWIKVFEELTEEEMINLEGSVFNFYKNVYDFFRLTTGYNEAIPYLEGKFLDNAMREYRDNNNEKTIEILGQEIFDNLNPDNELLKKLLSIPKKNKPRIMFFTGNWFDRGGLNRVISVIASGLSKYYEIIVCCMKAEGNDKGYELDPKVRFLEFEESEFGRIPSYLKLLDIDIFVSSNNCFVPLLNLYERIEGLGVKVIMWNHEHFFVPYFEEALSNCIEVRKSVYDKVSVSLWLTDFSATLGAIFGSRTGVMRNPLSFSVEKTLREKDKPLNLISLARFDSPRKRLDRLVKVFSEVHKKLPNTKLYIVGKYDLSLSNPEKLEESIGQLITRLGIPEESIIFTGEIKNVQKYYMKAAINIMTSEREGFGLPILEAALFGIPSVVFSGGGMSELVADSVDGYIVPNNDIKEMASKIVELLENKVLLKSFAKAAYLKTQNYCEDNILSKWVLLIDNTLNLPKKELLEYLYKSPLRKQEISEELLKDIVMAYEEVVLQESEKIKHLNEGLHNARTPYIVAKTKKMWNLIHKQGILLTFKNIVLKVKKKFLG